MGLSVDVVIPVYRPGKEFPDLLDALLGQSVRPGRILLIQTEREWFDPYTAEGMECVRSVTIPKEQFDHGGTRHRAAMMLDAEVILFLTQDALPADARLIERLLEAFRDETVGAAYARQLPRPDCSALERYTRGFNYGPRSRVKSREDLPLLGIKTFFCSNVCAAYRRTDYEALGGFERPVIFNEDMLFAARLIFTGRKVAYCAEAQVIHSHNYTGLQQFHRNFDLGVSQADHPEIFGNVSSESEGLRMVRQSAGYLIRAGKPYLLFSLVWQSGWKYLGYCLGKHYQKLPQAVRRACSMNKNYWSEKNRDSYDKRQE